MLTGEAKYKSIGFFWQTSHFSTILITNNNLLNKRGNTEEADTSCFIEWLSRKIPKFHRITLEVEDKFKFSEKRL